MKKIFIVFFNLFLIVGFFYIVSPELIKKTVQHSIDEIYNSFVTKNQEVVLDEVYSSSDSDIYILDALITNNHSLIQTGGFKYPVKEDYISFLKLKTIAIGKNIAVSDSDLQSIKKISLIGKILETRYFLIIIVTMLALISIVYSGLKKGIVGGVGVALLYSLLWVIGSFYFRGDLTGAANKFLTEIFADFTQLGVSIGASQFYKVNNSLYFKLLLISPIIFFIFGTAVGIISARKSKRYEIQITDLETENKKNIAQLKRLKNAEDEFKKAGDKIAKLSSRVISLQMLSKVLGASLNLENALDEVMNTAAKLFGSKKCAIFLTDKKKEKLVLKKQKGYAISDLNGLKLNINEGEETLFKFVINSNNLVTTDIAKKDFNINELLKKLNVDIVMAAPLVHADDKLGIFIVGDTENEKNVQEDGRLMLLLATLTALAIKNAQLYEKTVELANKDGMTKMYNNRYFNEYVDSLIAKGDKFSMMMTDIDHFKTFNDTYGHQIGDFVLEQTAQCIINIARDNDLAARYGGEEFCLVMPDTNTKEAMEIAEKLRQIVEVKRYKFKEDELSVKISIGVSTFPEHAKDKDSIIKLADDGLYLAKEGGRNQVRCAAEEKGIKKSEKTVKKPINTEITPSNDLQGEDIFKF
ncbi:MAG: GGDEF domain-containing protein [Candidatus Muiribacteriota bacterium]